MGIIDDLKGKAQGLIRGNEQAIKDGIDKAGDFIDSKTGGKYADKSIPSRMALPTSLTRTTRSRTRLRSKNLPSPESLRSRGTPAQGL